MIQLVVGYSFVARQGGFVLLIASLHYLMLAGSRDTP